MATARQIIGDAVRAHTQDTLLQVYQARVKRDSVDYTTQGRDFKALVNDLADQRDNMQQQNQLQVGQLADRLKQKDVDDKTIRQLKGHRVILGVAVVVLAVVAVKE